MRPTTKRRSRQQYADIIFQVMQKAGRPVGAYDLITELRGHDLAPATVYRALDRLIRGGQAHKLESLNAFIACRQQHDAAPAFAICDSCGSVTEFAPCELERTLRKWCRASAFALQRATLELHGTCESCRAETAALKRA